MKTDNNPPTGIRLPQTQTQYNDQPNYCSIQQPTPQVQQDYNREAQQLLRELDMLNSRRNQLHQRLQQLGFKFQN